MSESSRLDELRRRVQKDPASLAFAQLAEEHRRAGSPQEAVRVCRAGLRHHPGYHSARVTLGRALLSLGELEAAARELDAVLHAAPENLAACRGLGEVHLRNGRPAEALTLLRRVLTLAPGDQELLEQIADLERAVPAPPGPPEEPEQPPAAEPPSLVPGVQAARPPPPDGSASPLLSHLERWLDVLEAGKPR